VKCPFYAEYYHCPKSFRNQNVVCVKCHKNFPLIKYQNNAQPTKSDTTELLEELDRIKAELEKNFREGTKIFEQMEICRAKDGHLKRKYDIDKEEHEVQESMEAKSNLQVMH
jgi:hypothetical protein